MSSQSSDWLSDEAIRRGHDAYKQHHPGHACAECVRAAIEVALTDEQKAALASLRAVKEASR